MPFKEVSEITAWLGKVEDDLQPLHDRMSNDLLLWRMEAVYPEDRPTARDGHREMVRNDARSLAEKVAGTLLSAKPAIRVPLVFGKEQNQTLYNDIEKMLAIALDDADTRSRKRMQGRVFSWMVNDVAPRGWVCGLALALDTPKGIAFDIRRWEPMETYFSVDSEGIDVAVHRRFATEMSLSKEYPALKLDPASTKLVEVLDVWEVEHQKGKDSIWNAIVVKGEFAKEPKKEKFSKLPVFIVPVPGPIPATDDSGERLNVEDWGESIFAANRNVVKYLNELSTEAFDNAISDANRGIVTHGRGAKALAEAIIEHGEENTVLAVDDPATSIDPIPPRPMGTNFQWLINDMEQQFQRGGLSYVSWGQIPGQLSALAISNLAAQESSFITPRAEAIADAYKIIAEAFLDQMKAKNAKFEGLFTTKEGKKEPISVTRWDDIPEIEVTVEPNIPGKAVQAAVQAQQMRIPGANGLPLLSDLTILEDILHITDPAGEDNRRLMEKAAALPFVQLQLMADSARLRNNTKLADVLTTLADRQVQQIMGPAGGNAPSPPASPLDPGTQPPSEAMSPVEMPQPDQTPIDQPVPGAGQTPLDIAQRLQQAGLAPPGG